jgi:ABC-type multidrug transport system fused ATPase/permease subunit
MHVLRTVLKTFSTLTNGQKLRLILFIVVQALLGLLDLLGILAFGLVASLATSVYLNLPQGRIGTILISRVNVFDFSIDNLITALVSMVLIFFITKTLLALYLSKKMFHFLAEIQNRLSKDLFARVLNSDFAWFDRQAHSKIAQIITRGSTSAITIQIGNTALLISDFALILFFLVLLFILNVYVALFFCVYIFAVFVLLNILIGRSLSNVHTNLVNLEVEFQTSLRQSFRLFREIRISGRQKYFTNGLEETTNAQAFYSAKDAWIQQIPKYALEIALIFGAVLLILTTQLMGAAQESIPVLSVYLIGATRIFPTLLRIQSSFISLKSNQILASSVHDLLEKTSDSFSAHRIPRQNHQLSKSKGIPHISISSLDFRYSGMEENVLSNVSLEIPFGQKVAVIGASGCGKSTFCDILLGIKKPTSGSVVIGNSEISEWIESNPGHFSYIPQEFSLLNDTVEKNITVFSNNSFEVGNLEHALDASHLHSFVNQLPEKLDTRLGEEDIKFSGGQQQRLAIARALYSQPVICIFDEVTSALDSITEKSIVTEVLGIPRTMTTIFITHRINAIREFERIILLSNGAVIADGSYDELSENSREFQNMLFAGN